MKLLHCADVHIDSPLGAHLPPDRAAARRSEILQTFADMAAYAVEHGAQAMLIAGDLFDAQRTTRRAAAFVLDTVRACPGLRFFCLCGNHDGGGRAFDGMQLPDNLSFFAPGFSMYTLGDVNIGGVEDLSDPNWYEKLAFPAQGYNILLLHGSVTGGEDAVDLKRLQGKNIDYIALGHYHAFREGPLDGRGRWAYAGCPEGRGFDECGEKGFLWLDTETRTQTFVPAAKRQLHEVPADITGCVATREVENAVLAAVEALPARDMVRVRLTGGYTVETEKDLPYLRGVLEKRFYFADVADDTHLRVDPSDYERDISLKGEFVRVVAAMELPPQEKERVLACGLRALLGEELQL